MSSLSSSLWYGYLKLNGQANRQIIFRGEQLTVASIQGFAAKSQTIPSPPADA